MRPDFLLEAVGPLKVAGDLPESCTGLTHDSRRVTPGAIFFALPGLNTDGAQHILEAVRQGAAVIVTQTEPPIEKKAFYVKVADARRALARATAAFYGHPTRKIKLLGVTGTNGKTTVAFLTQHLLCTTGTDAGLVGTVHYDLGHRCLPAQRTTPEAPDLHGMFAAMRDAGCSSCVMEVSSHAVEQHRVEGLEFAAAAFTNLTRDHLDYHGNMEAYYRTKKRIFSSTTTKGRLVINIGDEYGQRLAKELTGANIMTTAVNASAELSAIDLSLQAGGSTFSLRGPDGDWPCSLPLIGRYNVANALTALGLAQSMGAPWDKLTEALAVVPPVPGRLETIHEGQLFNVFVDYAHTDDALRQVLATLRELTPRQLLVAFGCGGNRDEGKRRAMGRVAAELADATLVTTDNPRGENPDVIARQVEEGYHEVRVEGCDVELDRERAIDEILRKAREGDTVLIAGKGHETMQEYGEGAVPFDDRKVARAVLAGLNREG